MSTPIHLFHNDKVGRLLSDGMWFPLKTIYRQTQELNRSLKMHLEFLIYEQFRTHIRIPQGNQSNLEL